MSRVRMGDILRQGGERVDCPYCDRETAAYPRPGLNGATTCVHCSEAVYYDGEKTYTINEIDGDPDTVWRCPSCGKKFSEGGWICADCHVEVEEYAVSEGDI